LRIGQPTPAADVAVLSPIGRAAAFTKTKAKTIKKINGEGLMPGTHYGSYRKMTKKKPKMAKRTTARKRRR